METRRLGPHHLVFCLLACGGQEGPTVAVDPSVAVPESPASPVCVWNHAYAETADADTIDEITTGAVDCYVLLDPFEEAAAHEAITALRDAGNTVGCYISVGTCEDWRDDFDAMRAHCTTREWSEWEGEFFVSSTDGITPFMQARIDQMAGWGCDFVEFDNMDWAEDTDQAARFDLDVTPDQADTYARALCDAVHAAGMRCMAKNYRPGADTFDGGTFESFPDDLDWWEHDHLQSFIDAGQLAIVFHYDERDCDDVALWYRQRYGRGVSFLCEDRGLGAYAH